MGTKVHNKSYLPGYNNYAMRDLNEDSSSSSWPLFYGEKPVINGQYYNNGFMPPGTLVDGYPGHEREALKQKMLEHEAVFKNQVCELHRLYRIQRDMMAEAKRKEQQKHHRESLEPSSSSSFRGSHMPSDKWHMAGFPLLNPGYGKTGIEIVNSPLNCTKAYNTAQQQGQFPFHDGPTSKDFEIMESRPLKVRKKLFDLQLPADEYLDNEDGEKARTDIGMADLNEPVQVEETMAPSHLDFLGKGINQSVRSNASYSGLIRETNGFLINSSIESKVNERGRLSRVYEEGSNKVNFSSVTQGRDADILPIPSHPAQAMLNQVHQPHEIYPTGYSRDVHLRDGPKHGLDPSDRTRDSFISSCFPSSWAKPSTSFAQKLTTYGSSSNSAAAMSTCLPFGGKWQANGLTPVNGFYHGSASGSKESHVPGFDYLNCNRSENANSDRITANNGFFVENNQKSLCRADSRPAIDINLNEVVSNEVQDLNTIDGKSKHEDDLLVLPWLQRKPVHGNNEASSDQLYCKNEKVELTSTNCKILRKKEIPETQNVTKILGIPIGIQEKEPSSVISTSTNLNCHAERKDADSERKNRTIDINLACEPDEDEESILENEKPEKGGFVRDLIDLNSCFSECEEPLPPPSYKSNSGINVKIPLEIDLEVSIFPENEDDSTLPPDENMLPTNEQIQDEILRKAAEMMVSISSFCSQSHEDDRICQLPEASLAESLLWFVDACGNELERPDGSHKEDYVSEEIDDFEAMTLRLEETKEEDYMPKPLCPEFLRVGDDNVGLTSSVSTRPRRGQARRGRQRRDFQRDILPGLTSLSRHEVTEDIQTFGGLMRATGHSWSSGLARRNGSRNGAGRGRRRAVVESCPTISPSPVCAPLSQQQHTNVEAGLEDRNLTGWGKTTRRPRRQRCHAGGNNTPTVVLT